jgi:hypothetical protein
MNLFASHTPFALGQKDDPSLANTELGKTNYDISIAHLPLIMKPFTLGANTELHDQLLRS